ncbi:hypothetical protein PFISCL1PPCAC_24599 [Pristionchus fissidentatus]|uniref:Amine oxidase domain-containing protein n=1 Tax=Pristionchus fissidentatus TaxID=1538716 RepID=A0AAV5WQH0_9BILA|nr:hypothetical protein PFISCL1PPCAC_24599 [Pristionchus fissidentatus]
MHSRGAMLLPLVGAFLVSFATAKDLPVCVIGAGIAGLKTGVDLEAAKIPYVIVEGNNRIGGRVHPVKYEDGYLQYGATYINGDNNPIYSIAKANNLVDFEATKEADDYQSVFTQDGVIEGCDVHEFAAFTDSLSEKYKQFSIGGRAAEPFTEAFDKNYKQFLKKKRRASRKSRFDKLALMYSTDMETEWAALMSKYVLANYEKWDDGSKDKIEYTLNKMGFKKILDVISSTIPQNRYKFNSTVTGIDYSSGNAVQLSTSSGKIDCSSAIVTVSLGFLKKHAKTLFKPLLSKTKTTAINALGFGDMQKVFLVYDKPWLTDSAYRTIGPSTSTIFGRGLGFDITAWSKKTIQFWFSGPAVPAVGKLTDEQLMKEITAHLKSTLRNFTVPTPKRVIRHMWYQDPLVLGSYSYLTPASVALGDANAMLAEPISGTDGKPLVQFAGEATHSTVYQTTIGAFLTGEREVKRLISARNNKS